MLYSAVMPLIRTTLEPWREIEVTEGEYLTLLRKGLIYTGEVVVPPPSFTDAQYLELADPNGEAARRVREAALAMGVVDSAAEAAALILQAQLDEVADDATTARTKAEEALTASAEPRLRYLAGQYALPTSADNTETGVQDAINAAVTLGIRRLVVPARDSFGAAEWIFPKTVTLPPFFELDLSQARTAHADFPNPAFYVPFTSPGAKITLGRHRRLGGRRALADYPSGTYYGVSAKAANAVALIFADNVTVTGGYAEDVSTDWRIGLRFSNGGPDGNNGLRVGNTVDSYRHPSIDFPLIAVGQRGFLTRSIQGTYSPLANTDDPPHQIYLTETAAGQRSIGTHIMSAQTWNGSGGCAWSIKGQHSITLGDLYADACPGGLQFLNNTGNVMVDTLHVTNIYIGAGGMPEGMRSNGGNSDPTLHAVKSLGRARITHAPGVAAADIRAMSIDEYWKIGSIDHEYTTDEVTTSQSSVHVFGDRSDITSIRIRNLGTGGVRGVRYASGTGHVLRTAPSIDGASIGVQIDDGVTDSTIHFDPNLVRTVIDPSTSSPAVPFKKVVYPRGTGVRLAGIAGRFGFVPGEYVPTPKASALADITLSNGLAYLSRIEDLADSFRTNGYIINVRGGGAGISLRVAVYTGPDASGAHKLIADLGTVATTATGEVASTPLGSAVLVPADAWVAVAAQGGTALARGALGPVQSITTTNTTNVLGALVRAATGVSGAFPATLTPTAGADANTGYVRVALKVA